MSCVYRLPVAVWSAGQVLVVTTALCVISMPTRTRDSSTVTNVACAGEQRSMYSINHSQEVYTPIYTPVYEDFVIIPQSHLRGIAPVNFRTWRV